MDIRARAVIFAQYVGLRLKGEIATRGFTANQVAKAIDRSPSAFNRWINGKAELPLAVLGAACEHIGVEPGKIVQEAYDRLADEYGEPLPANVIAAENRFDQTRKSDQAYSDNGLPEFGFVAGNDESGDELTDPNA